MQGKISAIIPAAGAGHRMRPLTGSIRKPLLPIVDRPAIQYAIQEVLDAGIESIVIVTPPDGSVETAVAEMFGNALAGSRLRPLEANRSALPRIDFVVQKRPLGLGHAVAMAMPSARGDHVAVVLPDVVSLRGGTLLRCLVERSSRDTSWVSLKRVNRQQAGKSGWVKLCTGASRAVRIRQLEEKPDISQTYGAENFALSGRYVLARGIEPLLRLYETGMDSEIQLTDAISAMAETTEVYGLVEDSSLIDSGSIGGLFVAGLALMMENSAALNDVEDALSALGCLGRGRVASSSEWLRHRLAAVVGNRDTGGT